MQKYKILFAPVHFFLSNNFGGELSWAYEIFQRISSLNGGSVGICFYRLIGDSVQNNVISKGKIDKPYFYNLSGNLTFLLFYVFRGYSLLRRQHFQILHHILPFSIGRTFNPLFFLDQKTKKVIGPLQTDLNYCHTDLGKNSFFEYRKEWLLTTVLVWFRGIYRWLSHATLHRANRIVAINNATKESLIAIGLPSEKIVIIPPGIDVSQFSYTSFGKKNKDVFELIAVSYLIERKGVELVIQALGEVVRACENVRLRIVGDGPQRGALEELVKRLGLENHVVFQGFVSNNEVQKFYQKAHIFVSMSRSESWGQTYIEAMACGLPVISSRSVGSESIIREDEFGYLVEQENVKELAEKLVYLIEHPDVISSFGEKARQEVEEKYDWEKVIIPKYLDIYRKLINKNE